MNIQIEKGIDTALHYDFAKNIQRLLKYIPQEDILNLRGIKVFRIAPDQKHRNDKGYYTGYWNSDDATVYLCAQNIFSKNPKFLLELFPIIKTFLLADTLFHEIGHHYQCFHHGYEKSQWEVFSDRYSREYVRKWFVSTRESKVILFVVIIFKQIIRFLFYFNRKQQKPRIKDAARIKNQKIKDAVRNIVA